MYVLGIAVLFGLGIMAISRWVEHPLAFLRDRTKISFYPVLEVALGIGLAWAVDFNIWRLWGITMRADWVAVTLTGVALGGLSQFFTEILVMFGGLGRKLNDEAKTIESPTGLQRVA